MKNCLLIITEIVSRSIFLSHGVVSILILLCLEHRWEYKLLFIPQCGLVIETLLTLWKRELMHFRYFWPSGFFYVMTMIPMTWIIELDILTEVMDGSSKDLNDTHRIFHSSNMNDGNRICKDITKHIFAKQFCELGMFLGLIVGRWMIPRGTITRDQLSALLLGFVGTTADILEIFELFKEENIQMSNNIIFTVISLYSLATFQFTLVTTATCEDSDKRNFKDIFKFSRSSSKVAPKKSIFSISTSTDTEKQDYINEIQKIVKLKKKINQRGRGKKNSSVANMAKKMADAEAARKEKVVEDRRQMNAELFQILVTLAMQDGPFLMLRLYAIIVLEIMSEMHLFFTCKNILVVLLLIYRLVILNCDGVDEDDDWHYEDNNVKLQHIQQAREDILYEREDVKMSVVSRKESVRIKKDRKRKHAVGFGTRKTWPSKSDLTR